MLHEIVEPTDDEQIGLDVLNEEEQKDGEPPLISPHCRLEVVKITRCKMRAKDVLEIEIGLKNLTVRNLAFEERRFILRFLNKLDANLNCKGRILITGNDLLSLQKA